MTKKDACKKWVNEWDNIPGSVIKKLVVLEEGYCNYSGKELTLLASPKVECCNCGEEYDGEKTLENLQDKVECEDCGNKEWRPSAPKYAFPCGWGTLFGPCTLDGEWIEKNLEAVTKCGIYVFDSEDFGIILGIDGGGYDFYESYWIPLYNARGLQWHDKEEKKEPIIATAFNYAGNNSKSIKLKDDLVLYFSYDTLVGFGIRDHIYARENEWGSTTGKHINAIEPDKKKRLKQEDFFKTYKGLVGII